jgi:hypothetical protein
MGIVAGTWVVPAIIRGKCSEARFSRSITASPLFAPFPLLPLGVTIRRNSDGNSPGSTRRDEGSDGLV